VWSVLQEQADDLARLLAGLLSRRFDQPPNGGGNYFSYALCPPREYSWWRAIDERVV